MGFFGIDERAIEMLMLVFARISMIIAVLPIFGSTNVPVTVKIGLSAFLSIIVYSFSEPGGIPDGLSLAGIFSMYLREGIIGLLFGFVTGFLFHAIQFAGHFISFQMGFAMVQVIDPHSQERVPIIGQFYFIMAMLLFMLINGHHLLLSGLVESFKIVPIGTAILSGELVALLSNLTGDVFVLALKIASPIMVTLFLTDILMGIIARTVPQMNIFFVSLPLKIGMGMILVISTLSIFPLLVERLLMDVSRNLNIVLRML